jgi:small subunit ribosomal protein S17
MNNNSGQRMKRVGTVVSDKMDKTIVVKVERKMSHSLYKRTMKKSKKFLAHDENGQAKIGDRVEIIEARPLSKRKRWRLARVLDTTS